MVPARYNFLYSSSRPALRAASGRPTARQAALLGRSMQPRLATSGSGYATSLALGWNIRVLGKIPEKNVS